MPVRPESGQENLGTTVYTVQKALCSEFRCFFHISSVNTCSTVDFLCVEVLSGGRTERENVYPNIHLQDALIDGLSPNRVHRANSWSSLLEERIWMNDDEPIRSTSVEQGCEISPSSAFFPPR